MRTSTRRRWLLVALAIVALAVALPVSSAHATEPTGEDDPRTNATATTWGTWMESHMTAHLGAGSVEQMASQMGMSGTEMPMDGTHDSGAQHTQPAHDMSGQSHC
jgi:hypothetical protein